MIVLLIVGLLLLFGVGQRVLDRMRLTDKQAIALIIAMIVGGFVPNIPLGGNVYVNLGGAVIPIAIGLYLWFTAGTAKLLGFLAEHLGGKRAFTDACRISLHDTD